LLDKVNVFKWSAYLIENMPNQEGHWLKIREKPFSILWRECSEKTVFWCIATYRRHERTLVRLEREHQSLSVAAMPDVSEGDLLGMLAFLFFGNRHDWTIGI
jgi:hypothetical protein